MQSKKQTVRSAFRFDGLLREHRQLLLGISLVLLTVVCYLPTCRNDFIWDDDAYVTGNANLHSLDGLRKIWLEPQASPQYYPLTFTTFWIENHLWGLRAVGYHIVNLCLHATSAVLLWCVLTRLTVPGAFVAAALFAVHPVGVESVAWITERKNVLSLPLALASLWCYLRFEPPEAAPSRTDRTWSYYAAALIFFAAALLSKTVVATLPAVILVILWWKRGRIDVPSAALLVPFFLLGIISGLGTAYLEKTHVGAEGIDWLLSPTERLLLAGRVATFYAGKLCFPHPLIFIYPRWTIDSGVWWQYLFPLGVAAVVVILWIARHRIGRGPLAAALIFLGVLTPALGFFDVYPFRFSYVADHFQYHASTALIALGAAAGTLLALRPGWHLRNWGLFAGGLIIVLCTLQAWEREPTYRNRMTLFSDVIAQNPDCWMAHDGLGGDYMIKGKWADALKEYERVEQLKPGMPTNYGNMAWALCNLRRLDEAQSFFDKALKLDPNLVKAQNNLGMLLVFQGKGEEAVEYYEKLVLQYPTSAEIHNNLAFALGKLGRLDEASTHFEEAIRLNPNYSHSHRNLGLICEKRGDLQAAIEHYKEAFRADPGYGEAHFNLGVVYSTQRRFNEAVAEYRQALAHDFDNPPVHFALGAALLQSGQAAQAIFEFQRTIEQDPLHFDAYRAQAQTYAMLNQPAECIKVLDRAVKVARSIGQEEIAKSFEKLLNAVRSNVVRPPSS